MSTARFYAKVNSFGRIVGITHSETPIDGLLVLSDELAARFRADPTLTEEYIVIDGNLVEEASLYLKGE